MRRLGAILLVLVLFGLFSGICRAQCVYRTIHVSRVQGAVFDPYGEPIPDAEVSLNRDGKVVARTTTDEEGRFSIPAAPGTYDLHASDRNFAPDSSRVEVGGDLIRELRSTYLWVILRVGVLVDGCSMTTTSRRRFEKMIQKHKQRN
jgi:hypothetical protein